MFWKGVGVLGGTAAAITLGVIGLGWMTINIIPSFGEGFAEASTNPDGSLDFVPTVIGGELSITGVREGTMELTQDFREGPGFGLSDSNGRLFFESDPLSISQMYFEDLAFFPDPQDCTFTPGEFNEDRGIAAVRIECPELTDIRDKGAVSVDGYAALPAIMVLELDLPDIGGTVNAGAETWEFVDAYLFIGPEFNVGGSPEQVFLGLWTDDYETGMSLNFNRESQALTLSMVTHLGTVTEVPSGVCSITTEVLARVSPQMTVEQLELSCDTVEIRGMGAVSIDGTVVFTKEYFDPTLGLGH